MSEPPTAKADRGIGSVRHYVAEARGMYYGSGFIVTCACERNALGETREQAWDRFVDHLRAVGHPIVQRADLYDDAVAALFEPNHAPLSTTLGWLIRQGYLRRVE